ncbi:HD-GYP domain-containing protein [Alkalicella caledoniensis]|uniref:HD-GYP domain-containing protein n=1 Tax=Alkalicella caledoniensis TaxID=2731377 RepID=A0A7G9W4Z1_ALKCA|nr:HD-GYP domain-containing protein [Alkalicella caledoniensis]QNO13753.1 HD-GYP domain-containing protein [Alkalicella caledoniensis]
MRLVPIVSVKEGYILGKSLYNENGQLLIAKNTGLTQSMISKIVSLGYNSVYIASQYTENEIDDIIKPKFVQKTMLLSKRISGMIVSKKGNIHSSLGELSDIVDEIIDEILNSREIFLNLLNVSSYDDYTYKHCLNVMFLSISIGRTLGYTKGQLHDLAIGALFHDIGKLFVPKDILLKPSALSNQEFELMKSHSRKGFDFLKEYTDLSAIIRIVSLDHHEKWDGTGYPQGKKGDEIHPFGRIVAACDVFEALTANRPYRKEISLWEAREYILGGGGSFFDFQIVQAFAQTVNPFPVGSYVRLSDGREGMVKSSNKNFYTRPVVEIHCEQGRKIDPYTFDMLDINSIIVEDIIPDFSYTA